MSSSEHIEELLNGFLDGELTAGELREFELAMSADATLAIKLEQFRQLGDDLRSVPKRKLGPDFADRVLAAAGQEGTVSVPLDSRRVRNPPKTSNGEDAGNWWRAVGVLAALAASATFALYVSNWFPSENSRVSQVVTVPQVDATPRTADSNEGGTLSETESQSDSTFVRKTPMTKHFAILPIFEIETSPKAWDTNLVGTILKNVGIVWTKPVSASDEVIRVLNETRSINQGPPSSGGDQVALVMVQASSLAIDKAMVKIFESKIEFPHVMMDLAFDMPGKELFEKVTGEPAFATPISARTATVGNLGNVSQFSGASSAKRTQPLLRFDSASISDAKNETTNVLLVIRKPAK